MSGDKKIQLAVEHSFLKKGGAQKERVQKKSAQKANSQEADFTLAIKAQLPSKGITAIYGPSGCGKTTLLRCIAGLEQADHSQLHIGADDLGALPAKQRQLGYVFQEDRLFPHLSVDGNLNFAWKRRFSDNGPSKQQVIAWLDIEILLDRKPDQLSGGQKQRVAIARALLTAPRCLLLDEPLAGVDSKARNPILRHLETLAENLSIPMVYVSHNLDEITRLADHLIIMDQGRLVAEGPLLDMLSRLDLDVTRQESAAVVLNTRIVDHDDRYSLTQLALSLDSGVSLGSESDAQLSVGQLSGEPGNTVRVRIPSRDVSIALERPSQSSILNILPGVISEIESIDGARVIIKTEVAGQAILARITRKSMEHLQLETGKQVYLQIKTVALLSETLN
ncbi:MAG: molybdenum ABC transporter ATP-binding protein [Porticoccus sp.]|nr:molybdenum ABC transporter ATP-binding protein [Porticoccus sp.]MBQ0807884.1 molybdenum ABC transporter ATP-binding protein [Porticoccus sp.]